MARCLVVDEDEQTRAFVADCLDRVGFASVGVPDGASLREALRRERFEVIVLDAALPGECGVDLLRWLRAMSSVPVVLLDAHDDAEVRATGLELGADDALGKPFEPRELVARIRAVLRRACGAPPSDDTGRASVVRFKGWKLDRIAHRLLAPDGGTIVLSPTEHRLLEAFVAHPQCVLSRERLLDLVREGQTDAFDRSIDLGVARLRGKLGDTPRDPKLIRTIRGEGYLFDAVVTS